MGKPIIMGRKTFESIGKPLPGRKNIILTRDKNYQAEDCIVVHSREEALSSAANNAEVMVIGGAEIYNEFLKSADRIYLTLIHADFDGDIYFPEIERQEWREKDREDFESDDKNPYSYSFITLERLL